jgi:hypothetical protein
MFLAAGDQGDVEALGAELAGGGYTEAAAGSDDGDGRHSCPFWTDAGLCSFWLPTRYPGDSDNAFRASFAGVLQRIQILDVSLWFVQPASGSGDLPPAGGKGKAALRFQRPRVVHCAV